MSLVDYLEEKLDLARAGCTCPTEELMASLPVGVEVLADCVEHGRTRKTVGGFYYEHVPGWRWPWRRRG